MKCLCRVKGACHRWGVIHLVDKCLLIILILLMLQSAVNLFVHESVDNATNAVDIVIRTSAASIFGYLISANFNQDRKRRQQSTVTQGNAPLHAGGEVSGASAQIGFQAGDGGEGSPATVKPPTMTSEEPRSAEHNYDRAQIMVVATVGIISLLVLLVFRNLMEATPANAGSLTQFRDFVSGSVGFLISCSTSGAAKADK